MKHVAVGALPALITATRKSRGITQAAAAEKAGITPATWSNVEKGMRSVGHDTMTRMAQAVGIEVEGPFFVVKSTRKKTLEKLAD